MIQGMTRAVKESWLLKGFLGLVMMSFGIWGVGDAIRPPIDPNVVLMVEDFDIRTEELQRRFLGEVRQVQNSLGPQFTGKQAVELGILDQIQQQLINWATANVAVTDWGIIMPPEVVRDMIQREPAFHDQTGQFNQSYYYETLSANQLSEGEFFSLFTSDLKQKMLFSSVTANAGVPLALVDGLLDYRTETRIADSLLIDKNEIDVSKTPNENELIETYERNIAAYTSPEYRNVTAILILPDDLVDAASISEDEQRIYYEENRHLYEIQEKRQVAQIVFDSKEEADRVYEVVIAGKTLSEAALETGINPPVEMGEITADELIGIPQEAVFGVGLNGVAPPTESDFGWHLFEVRAIQRGAIQMFEAVQQNIVTVLIEEQAVDLIYEASVFLEDELAAGTPLKEISTALGTQYLDFTAIDREGKDPNGLTPPGYIDKDRFLLTAFNTEEGQDSALIELEDGGIYTIRIEKVILPTPKPFSEVRPEVVLHWQQLEQGRIAENLAVTLTSEIGPSTSFPALAAADDRVTYAQLGPVNRFGESLQLDYIINTDLISQDVLERLFAVTQGESFYAPVEAGHAVARLREIGSGLQGRDDSARDQVLSSVKNSMGEDLLAQLFRGLKKRYPAVVNQEALDQLALQ